MHTGLLQRASTSYSFIHSSTSGKQEMGLTLVMDISTVGPVHGQQVSRLQKEFPSLVIQGIAGQ